MTDSVHKQTATTQIRDDNGHFVKINPDQIAKSPNKSSNPLSNLFSKNASINKTTDDDTLINVHINNPLKKIIEILRDIKKQKAFSFTLKGSFGIMGVAIVLAGFGLFGGSKILCDKGIQSQTGILRILTITEKPDETTIGFKLKKLFNKLPATEISKRIVLISSNNTIHLLFSSSSQAETFNNRPVIVTGKYNSCNLEMKVLDDGVEME